MPSQTWQQLTGQPLPAGMTPADSHSNPEDKLNRELFVGNTTPEMTSEMIRDFLGRAMEQVGLTTMPGNPINQVRTSGKFAFVELRTKEEAANAVSCGMYCCLLWMHRSMSLTSCSTVVP